MPRRSRNAARADDPSQVSVLMRALSPTCPLRRPHGFVGVAALDARKARYRLEHEPCSIKRAGSFRHRPRRGETEVLFCRYAAFAVSDPSAAAAAAAASAAAASSPIAAKPASGPISFRRLRAL